MRSVSPGAASSAGIAPVWRQFGGVHRLAGAWCVRVPDGCVRIRNHDGSAHLRFWNTEVELIACASCGAQFAPGATLLAARERIGDLLEITTLCPIVVADRLAHSLSLGWRKRVFMICRSAHLQVKELSYVQNWLQQQL